METNDYLGSIDGESKKVLLERLSVFQVMDYLKKSGSVLIVQSVVGGTSYELLLNSRGDLCYRIVGDKMVKLLPNGWFKQVFIDSDSAKRVESFVVGEKSGGQVSNNNVKKLITSINTIIDGIAGAYGQKPEETAKNIVNDKKDQEESDCTKLELAKIMLNDLYDEVLGSEGKISMKKFAGNTYDVTVVLKSDVRAKIFTKKLAKWNFKNVVTKGNIVTFRQYFPQDQVDDALFVGMDIK